MRKYETGLEHLLDGLALAERGVRLLLAEFESREIDGQTPPSMRGLVVNAADIERSLQEPDGRGEADALALYRQERLEAEAAIERAVNASLSEGIYLPFAYLSWSLQLTAWEKRCVLLCLAAELDPRFEGWFGYLNDDVTLRTPTVWMALRLLGDPGEDDGAARRLLAGQSKLARFAFRVDKAAASYERSSLKQPLRLDPRIVSFLLDTEPLDARLTGLAASYGAAAPAPALLFDEQLQERLRQAAQAERSRPAKNGGHPASKPLPFVHLSGPAGAGKKLHARHLAEGAGQPLLLVEADKLARDAEQLAEQLRRIEREAVMTGAILGFDEGAGEAALQDDWAARLAAIRAAVGRYAVAHRYPMALWLARQERRASQLPLPPGAAPIHQPLAVPDASTRLRLWRRYAGERTGDGMLRLLADKYAFTAGQIAGMCLHAERLADWSGRAEPSADDYAAASRAQVQHRLNELAVKQTLVRRWPDLVLPDEPLELLKDACSRHKHNETVLHRWGFGRKLPYGRGLSMLFAGPPGTGKTMAAEVVAGELGLELYRIDLSRVVSKYIGETEKNLRELFAEAENSGAVLFFDEGDSLFGKRTEIKDSNDRFANMEAAYLLQRIETFDGVSILATNLLQNMDEAFLRRMQVVVKFPFPDAAQRELIFRSLLPKEAPLDEDLDLAFLAARIDASGGHIKNIVLSAAYMAASEQAAIGMRHMIRAARQELHKMGKIVVKEAFEPYV
ncbi:AAA family ATPase [Paenibacillus arenilitoris]|uniref:ATP-binding protein n=1 Tax=Paenibacillus arenilitoris TaxID=2772299 RepID=A0A927CKK2_9BACL|nr:AAA family ATPase [Paenibacillus arenilitoris]MBD2867596.1 ATP-binding protein [Paenibacillus arenilitoris]